MRAIPKRKPPSQRPENKLDETAKAIARMRDEARPAKSSETARKAARDQKPHSSDALGRNSGQAPPPSTTRRRKTGGG